jgi:hypothetical protein
MKFAPRTMSRCGWKMPAADPRTGHRIIISDIPGPPASHNLTHLGSLFRKGPSAGRRDGAVTNTQTESHHFRRRYPFGLPVTLRP